MESTENSLNLTIDNIRNCAISDKMDRKVIIPDTSLDSKHGLNGSGISSDSSVPEESPRNTPQTSGQISPNAVAAANETSNPETKCISAKVKRDQAMMTPIQTVPDDNAVINTIRTNNVTRVTLAGVSIVALTIDGKDRLCLAQISNTLLKDYSYNEIHNRRVALGITCVQCTPVQLEILRRAGAMPASSRRCGMITRREAERLVKSFLEDNAPPQLPEDFAFNVKHECGWGCHGQFIPSRYNSSRAKCLKCSYCNMYFSPNKFIFHYHRTADSSYRHPDAANFNSWRRHLYLSDPNASDDLTHAWEDVKAMFNGGIRKRVHVSSSSSQSHQHTTSAPINSFKDISSPNPPEKRPKLEQKSLQCNQSFNNNEGFPKYKYPVTGPPGELFSPKPRLSFPMSPSYPVGIPDEAAKVFPGPGGTWSPSREALYHPPYEMIWARHLGLTTPESSFALASDQVNKSVPLPNVDGRCHRLAISPRREAVPVAARDNGSESRMMQETSGFKLYRPFDNVIEKSHLSAFKPVITSNNLSPVVPIDFSMNKENKNQTQKTEEMVAGNEDSESEDEVLDVDTVDDSSNEPVNLSETATSTGTERLPEHSVIKTVSKPRQLSSIPSENITVAIDQKINKLLDETSKNIQSKLEMVEKDSDDALNNNNDEISQHEVEDKESRDQVGKSPVSFSFSAKN